MSNYDNTITYGGETLWILSMTPLKRQTTIKQLLGSKVIEIPVLGRSDQDYVLSVTGVIYESTYAALGTSRGDLEALDDGDSHALVDGIHDGNYVIETGSLQFQDSGDDAKALYRYTMRLIQVQ